MDRILIIGGTGTLGTAFIKRIYDSFKYHIYVLSRDEQKHQKMKLEFPRITFIIGDIRDRQGISKSFIGIDYVFNFAALKHIDVCENNIMESIKTNVLGSNNIAELCIENRVKVCIFSSTDKAVDPISVYGYSKALAERLYLDNNLKQKITQFKVYRWPNVTASNGSFIHLAVRNILSNTPVPITDDKMSRFWIKIETAVDFVIATYKDNKSNSVKVPTFIKSATILEIVETISSILNKPYSLKLIGMRGVEKISESLHSKHDCNHIDSSHDETRFSKQELKLFLEPIINEILQKDK